MISSLGLCVFLLVGVIDLIAWSVWSGTSFPFWLGCFHLVMFFVLVWLFREEFMELAEKHQARVVFTPRVYGFFSLAVGSIVAAVFFSSSFLQFCARAVLVALLRFWLGVQLFDFFPVKTRQVDRLVAWTGLLGVGALVLLLVGSVFQTPLSYGSVTIRSMFPSLFSKTQPINQQQPKEPENTGVTIDEIAQLNGSGTTTGLQETGTGEILSGTDAKELNGMVFSKDPLTYRVLLPYLDSQDLLTPIQERPAFALVPATDVIYPAFQRAWGMKLVGTNINPDWQVRCGNFMIIHGLVQQRRVDTTLPLFDAYWQEAKRQDALGTCTTQDQVATEEMLGIVK